MTGVQTCALPICIHYSFARDIGDPDLIHIAERWREAEALGAHGKSAHMAAFNKAMGSVTREGMDLWLDNAEGVRKLIQARSRLC